MKTGISAGFWALIKADAAAIGRERPSVLFYLAAMLGLSKFSAVMLFRIASRLHGKGKIGRVLAAFITRLNSIINGCELHPGAVVGPGLQMPHPGGVGIGPMRAGANLTLLQRCDIGLRDRSVDCMDPNNYPTLGDDVEIGPGACVFGPIQVGNRSSVGPNAVLIKDLPADAIAIGNPSRILLREILQSG